MAWDRAAAVNYLKKNTWCNGIVAEFYDWTTGVGRFQQEGFERCYVMNQCGLTATALKMVDANDPTWMLIRDTMRSYLVKHGLYGASVLRNYFYPIIDPAIIPLSPAFKGNQEKIVHDSDPDQGSQFIPRQVIVHWEPEDPLSDSCGSIRLNRALMRAIYHWNQGQTSTANTCYDFVLANRRPEGWHLADDDIDFNDGGVFLNVWKYRAYKQIIQWIAAKKLGRTRLHTDVLDMTQDPNHGGIRTFYKTNYSLIHTAHNTETTALAVIADILWNG